MGKQLTTRQQQWLDSQVQPARSLGSAGMSLSSIINDLYSLTDTADIRGAQSVKFQSIRAQNMIFINDGDENKLPDTLLDRWKSAGINTINLGCCIRVATASSTTLTLLYPVVKFQAVIDRVRAKGFKILFKPHIGVNLTTSPSSGGGVAPSDVPTFLNNYKTALASYMSGYSFDYVSISNELTQITNGNLAAWTDFITWMRSQQPNALLTSSQTFDEIKVCVFLSQLDRLGCNTYPQLQKSAYPYANPTIQDVFDNWFNDGFNELMIPTLRSLSDQYGKSVIITEFGCLPYKESLQATSAWDTTGWTYDEATQVMFYQATLELLGSCEFVDGVSIWFSPVNYSGGNIVATQAESVLIKLWGGN